MRSALLAGILLACAAGCNKVADQVVLGKTGAAASTAPAVHAPSGVVVNPGAGGGGSGGAAQAVRGAALRAVNRHEMSQLHLFMENASGVSGRMPTKEQIINEVGKESKTIRDMIQSGAIVLTGTTTRDGVWAYTADVQHGGYQIVITSQGVENKTSAELQRMLSSR